jgi:hypothetical protein
MSEKESSGSDIVWGLIAIGKEAGVFHQDGSVNVRVTRDRVIRKIIPAWKRDGCWQSARSVIRQKLTTGD